MEFPSNPGLEALIGRVCLVFARVEQEAGHVVTSAHGDWGAAMSTDYLSFSSSSGLLLDWLKAVGVAYPEVEDEAKDLGASLRELKTRRDEWAHSAAIVDLFLMMREQDRSSMSPSDLESKKLLNGRKMGHIDAPSKADVNEFSARASDVGDAASALGARLAQLSDRRIRPVRAPRKSRPRLER